MRIFKYPLLVAGVQTLVLPKGYTILTVQTQDNKPVLWAMVNDRELEKVKCTLAIYGTGHPIPDISQAYINTFQLDSGFIGHVFELAQPAPITYPEYKE